MNFFVKALCASVIGLSVPACVDTSGATTSMAVSQNRQVSIINNTGRPIWRLYGSRTSTNSWEEDVLGSDVLQNGGAVRVNFDDGTGACMFDLKAEFRDGRSIVQNNVNVCTMASVTFR